MTPAQSLAARGVLGAVLSLASFLIAPLRRWQRWSNRSFDRAAMLAFALSRLGLYALVFLVALVPPRGDVIGFYVPPAEYVLKGMLPYRDFGTSYGPLYPYLAAAVISLWHSPLALILFSIATEFLMLRLWLDLARRFATEEQTRVAALLYLASPISMQFVAIDGQNNIQAALLLVLAMRVLYRRSALSGGLLALSAVAVKFLPLMYVPLFITAAKRRAAWTMGLLAVLIVSYAPFLLAHVPILYPFFLEGGHHTANNVWYIFESLLGVADLPFHVETLALGVVMLATLVLCIRALRFESESGRLEKMTYGSAALLLLLAAFARKTWPPYLMLAFFPICLVAAGTRIPSRKRLLAFGIFSFAAVLCPSFWATVFLQALAVRLHGFLWQGQPEAWVLIALHVLLIAGYFWLAMEALHQLRSKEEWRAERDPTALPVPDHIRLETGYAASSSVVTSSLVE